MNDDNFPAIQSYSVLDFFTVLLVLAALLAAITSWGLSISQPFNGYTSLALTLGLTSIAMAILAKKNQ